MEAIKKGKVRLVSVSDEELQKMLERGRKGFPTRTKPGEPIPAEGIEVSVSEWGFRLDDVQIGDDDG